MAKTNNQNMVENINKARVAQPMLSIEEILRSPIDNLFTRLETSPSGLSSEEATNRLDIYGANELARKKKHTAIVEFLMNFKTL
jgi:magnesium-transporting ATPase (P-type)